MNSTAMEGTTIHIKPTKKLYQPKADELKPSGNPLSGVKDNCPQEDILKEQNPEGDQKTTTRTKITQLWTEMTNLKRGIIIGGITLFFTLLVLIILVIVAMSYKPTVILRTAGSLTTPTGEIIKNYQGSAQQKNLIDPNKNTKLSVTTITQGSNNSTTGRHLEDDTGSMVIAEFDHPKEGVSILATSNEDLIVHVDYDQMIASYSDKRLLFEVQLRATLRQLQDADQTNNVLTFDDPGAILKDAQSSLLKAVAEATESHPSDLALEYSETVVILQQADGTYSPDFNQQSSRLLRALGSIRGLQAWQNIFDDINDAVLKPKIEQAKEALKAFAVNPDNVENEEVREALKSSNFGSSVDIDVEYQDDTSAGKRQLQDQTPAQIPTNTTPSNTSSTTNTTTNKTTIGNKKSSQKKCRPVGSRLRSRRGQARKSKCFSESTYNATTQCTGNFKRRNCKAEVLNDTKSPYKVKKNANSSQIQKAPRRGRHTVTNNFRRENKKNPNLNKNRTDSQKKNLNVEPEKKIETPKVDPQTQPISNPTVNPSPSIPQSESATSSISASEIITSPKPNPTVSQQSNIENP